MDIETATNPVDGEDNASATLDADTGVEAEGQSADDQEFDEDGNAAAPEEEEVELGDLKLKVPKDAAAKLKELQEGNLRQADYTRKTQEVAELRKAVEAERTSLHQSSEAEVTARAQLVAIDQQLAHYQRIDWDAWENQDPFEAQKGWRQFQTLQNTRAQTAGQFAQMVQQRTVAQQQETAKLIDEGRAVLSRDIKDWSPQLAETLLDHGVKNYGFQRSEIEEFTDPRMVKVLHDAWQYRKSQAQQQKAQRHVAAQAVEPAAKPVAARSGPPAGLADNLSVDEWARRRNEQVRKRRR